MRSFHAARSGRACWRSERADRANGTATPAVRATEMKFMDAKGPAPARGRIDESDAPGRTGTVSWLQVGESCILMAFRAVGTRKLY